jgi:hypothetical protein
MRFRTNDVSKSDGVETAVSYLLKYISMPLRYLFESAPNISILIRNTSVIAETLF